MAKQNKPAKATDPKDSFLTGIGVAVAFISAAILLFFNKEYFGSEIATTILLVLFLIVGAAGLNTEIEKYTKKSLSFDGAELFGAFVFLVPWYIFQFQPHAWAWNILLIAVFLIGITFAIRWILRFGERIYQGFTTPGVSSKLKIISLVLAQIATVIAALLAFVKQIQELFA